MSDATPAVLFVLMLIAPCAMALFSDQKKKKAKSVSEAKAAKAVVTHVVKVVPVVAEEKTPMASATPVTVDPSIARTHVQRRTSNGRDPYAAAASLYEQPASRYIEAFPRADEPVEAEALLAQAAAAKAKAAELAAAARAAQAKAQAAADAANQAARAAAAAHRAAETERDIQAQITAQEQARTASGEHGLPETHPSLDFPRSGRPRRAA